MQSLFTYIRKDYITLPFSSILVKKKAKGGRKKGKRKEGKKKKIYRKSCELTPNPLLP